MHLPVKLQSPINASHVDGLEGEGMVGKGGGGGGEVHILAAAHSMATSVVRVEQPSC